jgi:Resolvase, N terminal domain
MTENRVVFFGKKRKIDDRLTESCLLPGFGKPDGDCLLQWVSFVSITQSFNTASSMGRLTLNVLLSFAQFEREVIGERVRDKIAASKRKGRADLASLARERDRYFAKIMKIEMSAPRITTVWKPIAPMIHFKRSFLVSAISAFNSVLNSALSALSSALTLSISVFNSVFNSAISLPTPAISDLSSPRAPAISDLSSVLNSAISVPMPESSVFSSVFNPAISVRTPAKSVFVARSPWLASPSASAKASACSEVKFPLPWSARERRSVSNKRAVMAAI